ELVTPGAMRPSADLGDDTGGPPRPPRFRPVRITLKLALAVVVLYFGVTLVVPGLRKSLRELSNVNPILLVLGFALEIAALFTYSLLTRAALGDSGATVSTGRLFRIQMSTKALSSIVPGGSAASSALGYRLMTMSGVSGPDAGFALATAGLGSAVVLNLLFWLALVVSIPIRGVSAGYATAAVAGIILMGAIGALIYGLLEGQGRSERVFRWIARKMRFDEDRAAAAIRHIGGRLEDLAADRQLLLRVGGWAAANWLLDAAALWVFLRAYGSAPGGDALLVAFGLVNVAAVIPILPGGLGTIDLGLPIALVGFGVDRATAVLGVGTYRLAQFFFPIVLGGMLYLTLRVGPWSIHRRERLRRLRDLAAEQSSNRESALDFSARFERRTKAAAARAAIEQAESDPTGELDPAAGAGPLAPSGSPNGRLPPPGQPPSAGPLGEVLLSPDAMTASSPFRTRAAHDLTSEEERPPRRVRPVPPLPPPFSPTDPTVELGTDPPGDEGDGDHRGHA
ncbi:MAG: lysylphosphatidylglycerol synthase transmembrane domain-containing protein, partial [Ilumatobacteraceae bacterium]